MKKWYHLKLTDILVTTIISLVFGIIYKVWEISRESFYRGMHVGFRAFCMGLMGLLFSLSTRPVLLFYSLMQQLNLPPKNAYGFMASLRLLPLVVPEFRTLRQAYQVKGLQFSKSWTIVIQTIDLYAVPHLARSICRAQRISVAMEARRFNNPVNRTYYYQVAFFHIDAVMTTCWIAILVGSWLVGWHFLLVAIKDVRF